MYCLNKIREAVLEQYGVDVTERTRKRTVADARFAVISALNERYNKSEIARAFDLNRGSVIHAVKQHEYLIKTQSVYSAIYELTRHILNEEGIVDVKNLSDLQHEVTLMRLKLEETKRTNEKLARELAAKASEVANYKPYKRLYMDLYNRTTI
jgi:hypothetical protein